MLAERLGLFCARQVFMLEKDVIDLIRGVKVGRHEDFELLKGRYMPLINDLANSFEESGAGAKSDLSEEAQRALLKAAISFDEGKEGITFGLYAKICMRNALISVKRAEDARRRKEMRAKSDSLSQSSRALTAFAGMDAEEILGKIESSLSPYELSVFKEYFSGRSARETAQVLGSDERSVNNAVYRIRRKAKHLTKK